MISDFTPTSAHNALKHLEVDCGPLSVTTLDGITKLPNQGSTNVFVTMVKVVFGDNVAFDSLEHRSIINITY